MPGISKHYVYTSNSGNYFDNYACEQLYRQIQRYLDLPSVRRLPKYALYTQVFNESVNLPWRKRLLFLWGLFKDRDFSWSGKPVILLKEFSCRRGRGIRHMNPFKIFAGGNRVFSPPLSRKKLKNMYAPQTRMGDPIGPPLPVTRLATNINLLPMQAPPPFRDEVVPMGHLRMDEWAELDTPQPATPQTRVQLLTVNGRQTR
jgi:hypothetical protein